MFRTYLNLRRRKLGYLSFFGLLINQLLVEKNHAVRNARSNISVVSIPNNDKLKVCRTPKNLFKQQIKIARTHDASPNVPNVVNKGIDSHFELVLKSL